MRAVRFGSYSISSDAWPLHTVFVVTTEVDDAVLALVATTDVTGRDAALRCYGHRSWAAGFSSDFSGVDAGDLCKVCNR